MLPPIQPEPNPVTDFLEHSDSLANTRNQKEWEQVQAWRGGTPPHNPELLQPLMHAYSPVMARKLRQWKAPAVPEAAFQAELQKHFIRALKTYNPNKGAALATHVENNLKKAQRFNMRYQNVAYIPEAKASKIGKIDRARAELLEDLGREPTHAEIGSYLGTTPKMVSQIEAARIRDIPASAFEDDPGEYAISQDRELLALLPYRLDDREKKVFNHLYGLNGAKQIQKGNVLAKELGMSPSDLSRIRTSILKKYNDAKLNL